MPSCTRRLTLFIYGLALLSFVSINMMLGYYVYVEMRAFNVVITGADRTARLPVYERSLFRSPDVAEGDVETYIQRRAFADLVDKIDDLGQTIRLLTQRSSATGQVTPDTIALVTPITSKGKIVKSEDLPLFSVSLPSLCDTASAGYRYTYFLCYTQGDTVFGNATVVQQHFDQIKQHGVECQRWRNGEIEVDFVLVEAGQRVTGKRGLSILFNLPTLHAYAAGYEYFYLINDDLRFVSTRWTEVLTDVLRRSAVAPHFGITGGLDVSSPQHFAEFPFFHRLHVEMLGDEAPAHPYVFHNWWEDNWMTDVYVPWNASYYRRDVLVKNYAGLEEDAHAAGHKMGMGKTATTEEEEEEGVPKLEPRRYEAVHHLPPPFYIREVERARAKVQQWLAGHLPGTSSSRERLLNVELEYCRSVNETLTLYPDPAVNPCGADGRKKP